MARSCANAAETAARQTEARSPATWRRLENDLIATETYARYKVLESKDVAEAVAYALAQPPHVQVHDLLLRPLAQPN